MVLNFEDFLNESNNKNWGYDGHNIRTAKVNVKSDNLMNELIEWFTKYLIQSMGAYGVSDRRVLRKNINDVISYRKDEDIDDMYLIIFKFKGGGPNASFLKNQVHASFDFILDKPIEKYTFFTLKDEFLDKLTMFISTDFADGELNGDDNDTDTTHIRMVLYNAIICADKTRKDNKLRDLLLNMEYDGKSNMNDFYEMKDGDD